MNHLFYILGVLWILKDLALLTNGWVWLAIFVFLLLVGAYRLRKQ